ncbi:MAG TPA: hypothetical protein VJS69_04635 [Candidatus Krumholzibacteria bacterium]|nr:hypothetical protein [Candidatus Krumholzibacteria bacterium]
MKQRLIVFVVIAALAAGVSVYSCSNQPSRSSREKLVEQFIKTLPDSLDAAHVTEIRKLFYTMWEREKLGKVKPETIKETTDELSSWVKKGHINQKELIHFMAEVGYNTYKDDKKFMLPDGSNDNPILNPNSARITMGFDSTQYDSAFWHDFTKWKKEHPALVDSINRAADSLIHKNPVPLPPKRK